MGRKKKKKQDYINFLPLTGCSNENLQIKYDSDLIGDFFFLAKKKKKKKEQNIATVALALNSASGISLFPLQYGLVPTPVRSQRVVDPQIGNELSSTLGKEGS